MPRLAFPLALILALGPITSSEAAPQIPESDRFELWNGCRPMRLVVESLDEDATNIGLKEKDLMVAARSRLRAARLYSKDDKQTAWSFLYVKVNATSSAVSIRIEYVKEVQDLATGVTQLATTWDAGGVGTHGRDPGHVLSSASRLLDKFIDEYLRVNEPACRKSK